jgi:hypothetical protein
MGDGNHAAASPQEANLQDDVEMRWLWPIGDPDAEIWSDFALRCMHPS